VRVVRHPVLTSPFCKAARPVKDPEALEGSVSKGEAGRDFRQKPSGLLASLRVVLLEEFLHIFRTQRRRFPSFPEIM
jgi:hypothetical protein